MFALRVTYLTGRVYSTVFDDGDSKAEPEWPPHPSRLFSALVAAWGDGGAEEELRSALEWIERQPAPKIYAGHCTPRKLVDTFVPVNDDVKEHAAVFREEFRKKGKAGQLPEDRIRKARRFPSATLSHPDVYFAWTETPPLNVRTALDQIHRRTSSIGHSASLVAVELADVVPAEQWSIWCPDASSGVRLRVPYPGRLKDLTESYRRFQKEPYKIHRPPLGKTTLYDEPARVETTVPRGVFREMIVVRRESGPRASLPASLSVITSLRKCILKLAPQPVPECLSGHASESTAENPVRSEKPHVALIPMPFVGAPHATGELIGLAALLPKSLTYAERAICWQVLSSIETLQMEWGAWQVSLTDAEEHRLTLRSELWTRSHDIWSTVTPFVFDRYPKDPYGREAEEIVCRAFLRIGLPAPCEIDLHCNPWHIGVPKAYAFSAVAARPGKPKRYHCHVRARFEQRIAGPVVAGAGRYYGYGLFRPLF